MEQSNGRKSILTKEYFLLVLLTVIFETCVMAMPELIIPGIYFVTVPIVLIYIKFDFEGCIIALLISLVLLGIIFSPMYSIIYSVVIYLVSMTFGFCIKENQKTGKTILYVTAAFIISIGLSIVIIGFLSKNGFIGMYNYINTIVNEFTNFYKSIREMYVSAGIPKDQIDAMDLAIKGITTNNILASAPGFIVWFSLFNGVLEYLICGSIIRARKIPMRKTEQFQKVYVDNRVAGIIIIVVCLGIILDVKNIAIGTYISSFFQQLMFIVFTLNGAAVLVYLLLSKVKTSKTVIIVTFVFIVIFQLASILMILGIIDSIIDFRKIDPNRLFRR